MRHCFEVHVAFDIGDRGPVQHVREDVERVLAEARDGLVLLQVDLGGTGDVSVTVEDAWPVGDQGSTQPLVDAMAADPELMAQLRRPDRIDELMARLDESVAEAKAALDRLLAQRRPACECCS